ncbi:MAG: hypothetical protein WHS77_06210 [Brevinematales bacterium]
MKFCFAILFLGLFLNMYGGEKIDTKKIIYLYNKTDYTIWATSELKEKGYNYSAKNLIDDRLDTVWATRVNGGLGEELIMFFSGRHMVDGWRRGIWIINGHGKNKDLFLKNNRVKELELKLYRNYSVGIAGATVEAGPPRESLLVNPLSEDNALKDPLIEYIFQTNITLRDEYLYTNKYYFPINFEENEKETEGRIKKLRLEKGIQDTNDIFSNYYGYNSIGYVLILTIKSIYKGSKYNDLCISEIWFLSEEEEGKTNK